MILLESTSDDENLTNFRGFISELWNVCTVFCEVELLFSSLSWTEAGEWRRHFDFEQRRQKKVSRAASASDKASIYEITIHK